MPYTAYSNLTLGTIAGVRKKLSSPDIALQLPAAPNDIIAVLSVDTTLNQITTGADNRFLTGDQIQFAGSSLPAPLVAATTYYAIYVSNTVFQVAAIIGGPALDLTTAGSGSITVQNVTLDAQITTALVDTKANDLANHLDLWLRDVMPGTIQEWVQLRSSAFIRYHPRPNLDTLPVYGMFAGYGGDTAWYITGGKFVEVSGDLGGSQKPATFFVTSPPTSTTLAQAAENGDRCIDVVAQKLYVNRGSSTVDWQRQNSSDGKDYLMNPTVLAQAHEYLATARLFTLGIFRNRLGYTHEDTRKFMFDSEAFWHNKFVSELYGERDERGRQLTAGVLKLLQVDFSNEGDFSDFDREMAGEEHFGFV